MARLKIYRGTKAGLDEKAVEDGALYVTTDTRQLFLDNESSRIEVSPQADISDFVTDEEMAQQISTLQTEISNKLSASNVKAGLNVSVSTDGGNVTISSTDTKYSAGEGLSLSGNSFSVADGEITAEKIAEGVIPDVSEFITESEANAAYAAKVHTHDDRYYTETEIDSKLDKKANLSHTHTSADITDFDESVEALIPEIPTELPNPEPLTISLNGQSQGAYDGSATKNINITAANIGAALATHEHAASAITSGTLAIDRIPSIPDSKITGINASKISGIISSSNLPSYVDDVLEYNGTSGFPDTGETGKIYVDTLTNKTYRWGGSSYVEISASLALGETSDTAYPGDKGKVAYDHAAAKGTAFSSGLYKITTNSQGHVTNAIAVKKDDITALGIPGTDTNTNTTYTLSKSGSTITLEGSDGSKTSVTDSDTNTTYSNMTGATTSAAGKAGLVPAPSAGSATRYLRSDGTWTVPPDTNTTYSDMKGATSDANGTHGLVPAPASGASNRYLRSDGTWAVPPDTNTTYTLSSFGITATAAELNKLDGCTATTQELNYVDGVTSNIQTQLNSKASTSHTHNYLPLSGGTLTGTLTARAINPSADSTYNIGSSTVRYANIYADTFVGALSGNATTATTATKANQWTTARTLSYTGDVTGSMSVNGTGNVSCTLSISANAVTANEIAAGAVGTSELASGSVTLAKLGSDVGTVAVQSSAPTDDNVKLWVKI